MKFNNEFEISVRCPMCGEYHSVYVEKADYFSWVKGKSPQDAFPYLNADDREILISGICPSCWNEIFGTSKESA